MIKPEKRKLEKNSPYLQYDKGYNHACNDWENFLKEKSQGLNNPEDCKHRKDGCECEGCLGDEGE